MDRDALSKAGIQLPVLPTIVLGGLPAGPDWPAIQMRLGVDVISSGASRDGDAGLAALAAAVPYRPIKAIGADAELVGRSWLVEGDEAPAGAFRIDPEDVVTGVAGVGGDDPNAVAAALLPLVRERPVDWWVVARDLADVAPEEAERTLDLLVEGVRMVRLFLAKQQFDL